MTNAVSLAAVLMQGRAEPVRFDLVGVFGGLDATDLLTVVLSLFGAALAGWVVSYRETRIRRGEDERRRKEEIKGLLILLRQEIELNQEGARTFKTAGFSAVMGAKNPTEYAKELLVERLNSKGRSVDRETIERFHEEYAEEVQAIVDKHESMRSSLANSLRTMLSTSLNDAVWQSCRVRLAQLIPADALLKLVDYYTSVETLVPLIMALTEEQVVATTKEAVEEQLASAGEELLEKGEEAKRVAELLIVRTVKPVAPYDF